MNEITISESLETKKPKILNTFKGESYEDKIKFANILNNPSKKFEQLVNLELILEDVCIVRERKINNDTGMEEDTVVTTMLFDNGDSTATNSSTFADALERTFSLFNNVNEWKGKMKIKLLKNEGKNGNKYNAFELL